MMSNTDIIETFIGVILGNIIAEVLLTIFLKKRNGWTRMVCLTFGTTGLILVVRAIFGLIKLKENYYENFL